MDLYVGLVLMQCDNVMRGTHFTLLALCEGNPPVTGGFPSQLASYMNLWWFFSLLKLFNKQFKLPVTWDTMMIMWHDVMIRAAMLYSCLNVDQQPMSWHWHTLDGFTCWASINTLRPRLKMAAIFKCILLNENVSFSIRISLKFVP